MPLVVKDRVMETTSSTGTGTITLGGAANGYQSFSVIGDGNTTYYTIVGGTEWEVGVGTYTASGTTLSRDTVLESSNSGSLVNFSAGTKNVFVTYPAEESVDQDTAQTLSNKTLASPTVSSNLTFTGTGNRITGDFSNGTISNRVLFQSSTTNGLSVLGVIPNGTSTASYLATYNTSTPDVSAFLFMAATSSSAQITSGISGAASYLPMTFSTGGSERMRIDASGNVQIGTTTSSGALTIAKSLTGGVDQTSVISNPTIQSDVTTVARGYTTSLSTAATSFTLTNMWLYNAAQGSIGAGSTVTNQIGFRAAANLTGATNNYGFFSDIASGTGRWNFYANGTANNYFAGNVGIGTSSPQSKFHVLGVTRLNPVTNTNLLIDSGGISSSVRLLAINDALSTQNDITIQATNFYFSNGGTERMRIDSSGNVGIGTSSPSGILDVRGHVYLGASNGAYTTTIKTASNWNFSGLNVWRNASNTSTPRFIGMPLDGDSDSSTTIGAYNAIWGAYDSSPTTGSTSSGLNGAMVYGAYAGHRWYTNGTERMRIDSSGNVGIGTSSPSSFNAKFVVAGAASGSQVVSSITNTSGTANSQAVLSLNPLNDAFNVRDSQIRATNNGLNQTTLEFYTANAATPGERMRITSDGNVGIGTVPSYRFHVAGDVAGGAVWGGFQNANASANSTGGILTVASGANNYAALYNVVGGTTFLQAAGAGGLRIITNQATPLILFTNATERMRIHASGGVSIGNTTDSGAGSLNVNGSLNGGYIAHAAGTTAMAFGADNVVRVTPNATATYTTTVPAAGAICVLSILTSGTTSYTITFGTGFKSTGTLATGTVSARYFNITFVSDGTNLIEMSRTVAIA